MGLGIGGGPVESASDACAGWEGGGGGLQKSG